MHFEVLIEMIKSRRKALRITQRELADLSEVGLRTLKQFESGKGNPTLMTVQKWADILGLELCLQLKDQPLDE